MNNGWCLLIGGCVVAMLALFGGGYLSSHQEVGVVGQKVYEETSHSDVPCAPVAVARVTVERRFDDPYGRRVVCVYTDQSRACYPIVRHLIEVLDETGKVVTSDPGATFCLYLPGEGSFTIRVTIVDANGGQSRVTLDLPVTQEALPQVGSAFHVYRIYSFTIILYYAIVSIFIALS